MTPAELFASCGRALFGDEYTSALARALGVERTTVQKMAAGKSRVPPGVWSDVRKLLEARQGEAAGLVIRIGRLS